MAKAPSLLYWPHRKRALPGLLAEALDCLEAVDEKLEVLNEHRHGRVLRLAQFQDLDHVDDPPRVPRRDFDCWTHKS